VITLIKIIMATSFLLALVSATMGCGLSVGLLDEKKSTRAGRRCALAALFFLVVGFACAALAGNS
jgi:hypothetical protein